jgi:ABC-type Fe3+ transport system permease subunit
VSGIVVRDGRLYWSWFALWWRTALLFFAIKFAMRFAFALPTWRAEPELWGIPGFSMPIAGMSAMTTPIIATLVVLLSYRERRRFNAAAPPVDALHP